MQCRLNAYSMDVGKRREFFEKEKKIFEVGQKKVNFLRKKVNFLSWPEKSEFFKKKK